MAQGTLALLGNIHHMPKRLENFVSKFDPENKMKVKDDIDSLYMHLWMVEVNYDDISCKFFHTL